jgi:hypothetical protein
LHVLPADTTGCTTAYLESGDDGDALQKRRINSAHRRRALEMLASNPHGATTKLLVVAYGFDNEMIAASCATDVAAT